MPIQIELRPLSSRYWAGEEIEMSLEIRNTGESPVAIPDGTYLANASPLYWVAGPSFPAGVFCNLAGIVADAAAVSPSAPIAVPIELSPGEDSTVCLRLAALLPVAQPGFYDVTARVACEGVFVDSPTIRFELLQPAALGVSITPAESNRELLEVPAAWAFRSRSGAVIVRRLHHAPEDGEVLDNGATSRVAEANASSSNPHSAAVPAGVRSRDWLAWFDGAYLSAHATGLAQPHTLAFPAPIAAIATPATLASGAMQLFVLTNAATLSLLHFPAPADEALPFVEWSAPLPAQPQALAAAGRRMVYSYECNGGVAVRHVSLESGSATPAEGSAFLPGVRAAGASLPHVRVCDAGLTHASLLVWRTGDKGPELLLATLTFNANGLLHAGAESALRLVAAIAAEPLEAAIDYRAVGPQTGLDWLVLLRDGQLLRSPDARVVPVRRSTPLRPLQLRSMEYVTLLGVHGANGEPGLQYV
jgi:hypothetical protein